MVIYKIEGKYYYIGVELVCKFGMSDEIAYVIEVYYDDIEVIMLEVIVVCIVDVILVVWFGARNISVENFIECMCEFENVVNSFFGIDKLYVISVG